MLLSLSIDFETITFIDHSFYYIIYLHTFFWYDGLQHNFFFLLFSTIFAVGLINGIIPFFTFWVTMDMMEILNLFFELKNAIVRYYIRFFWYDGLQHNFLFLLFSTILAVGLINGIIQFFTLWVTMDMMGKFTFFLVIKKPCKKCNKRMVN